VQHSGTLQTSRPLWVTISLAMGIASPVLFVVIVVVGGLIRPGYSHISQAISELTEAGAINKPLLDMGLYITEFMTIAFGLGPLGCAGGGDKFQGERDAACSDCRYRIVVRLISHGPCCEERVSERRGNQCRTYWASFSL